MNPKKIFILVMVALLVASLFLAFEPATASSLVEPVFVLDNPSCTDLAPEGVVWNELKIDPPADGTYLDDGTYVSSDMTPGGLAATVMTRVTNDGEVFDWTSNIGIDSILVKGGSGGNYYLYDVTGNNPFAEVLEDFGLHAPDNSSGDYAGLSHISFCYDEEATKSGVKFNDLDADGQPREAGEPGLEGWTIFVDYNGNAEFDPFTMIDGAQAPYEPSAETGSGGAYTIEKILPGTWTVYEVEQDGWICSFPNAGEGDRDLQGVVDSSACSYTEIFAVAEDKTGNDFGNWTPTSLSGMKFEDLDADGVKDAVESGLAGWTIFVDYDDDEMLDADEPSATTGADGAYTITGIKPGVYDVLEVGQAGWTCSFPAGCGYTKTFVSAGEPLGGIDFGNWTPATKRGMKFEDLDADGQPRETGEGGLPGWTIYVDYDDDEMLDADEPSAVTGAGGLYEITGINPGTWKVREVGQTGWTCSYPDPCYYEEIFTSRAELSGNDFGNWTPVSLSGVKFNDLDADGAAREAGEPGLAGWTIYVDTNGNEVYDAGEPFDITGEGGAYSIEGIKPGTFNVREVGQAGWTCSFPSDCAYTETFISSSPEMTGRDFGNWTTASKSGMKFEDKDADGVKDDGESGLSGWTIYVDTNQNDAFNLGEPSAVTGADGTYTITGIEPGTYKVLEVGQGNWFCSAPNAGSIDADINGVVISSQCYYSETFESGAALTGNDFGNWEGAVVRGAKFEDLDADGEPREDGEPLLSGWTVFVDYDDDEVLDADEPSGVTDANGAYTIDGIKPGEYPLREVGQTGWTCSYPTSCDYSLIFAAGSEFEGKDFGNWTTASKRGMKFEDLDADGVKDDGEPGLAGWTIFVDYDDDGELDANEPSAETIADGAYTISGINPGTWKVREVQQPGWTCSYPNDGLNDTDGQGVVTSSACYHAETFVSGADLTGNDFGNWTPTSLSGMKFEDKDADGAARETDEPGLSGWTIFIDYNGNEIHDAGEPSAVTGADGAYTVTGIKPGTYNVLEVGKTDWTCSFPDAEDCFYTEPFVSGGEAKTGIDFGNWTTASKSGIKFEDLDADGSKDAGESGLPGWTIYVDYDHDEVLDAGEPSATTGADGAYTITGINPGTWKVREVGQAGWTCSYPNPCYHEDPFKSSDALTGNDFGNWTAATKSGMKFNDLDADGVKDGGEPGLAGWTIYVDYDGDGIKDAGEPFAVTDGEGFYMITGIDPGTWKVREVGQAGWTCSFPDPCYYEEAFVSGAELTGNDFGNWTPTSLSGMKFEDLDADGVKDESELGLSGWTIFVDYDDDEMLDADEPSATTGADGAYTITGIKPGVYDVLEVGQAGWTCSFPAGCGYTKTFVSAGEPLGGIDFGNWTPATKRGMKFEDLDADGVKDDGEPGLAGWTIYVDYDDDGELDANEPSAETVADGAYTIEGIDPGTWKVREVSQVGWTCSFPDPCYYAETFESGADITGNDFGNWTTATKSGMKFEDLDADGVKDEGELGLSGWTIYVDYNGDMALDSGEPSAVTGADGAYTIRGINPGAWIVREVQQSGWTCSFPDPCYYEETFTSGAALTGNDFGNWTTATKSGAKFNDLNADGVKDDGEPGLSGWTIFVDYDGDMALDADEPSAVTGAGGLYEITGINPGTWKVREVGQTGWTCSYPDPCYYEETFISRAELSGNDFGNWTTATKSGVKFEDLDADGVRDDGEPGLEGWTIYVDYDNQGDLDLDEPSAVTGANGSYTITGIKPGTYDVLEVAQDGWTCSFPNAGETDADGEGVVTSTACGYHETFVSNGVYPDNDFGNWTTASKSGMKFEDLDADGVKDDGEPGLAGWTIYVDYDGSGTYSAGEPFDITGEGGAYSIEGIKPGSYAVREVGQAGWTCSFPDPCYYAETFESGADITGNDFGNWTAATKSGMKFNDLDADGVKDQLEPGLEGWTIYVDYDGDGIKDAGEPFAVTDGEGLYTITGIDPGTWIVREVQQSGWTCSYPDPCYYEETFTSRAALTGNDFGNWMPVSLSGVKFNDLDADGAAREAVEPGLPGWTIYVDYNDNGLLDADEPSAVTAADGAYTIEGIKPGVYDVLEVGQSGWTCSFPAGCGYTKTFVSAGEPLGGIDFGNWTTATKRGVKFEDLDADGVKDDGEPGLAGWTIYVDYDDDGLLDANEPSAETIADGAYTISGINPGTWKVREVQQPGWTCSYPDPCYYEETFVSGADLTGNDFGNWTTATKSGMKFEDKDADGIKDEGEPGLAGWTIYVDYDGLGTLDSGEPSAVTGADGAYTIRGINPGAYVVREVQQSGWFCSYPDDVDCFYTETFKSGDELTGNDFGNWQPTSLSGMKFHDLDADGGKDAGEPGLAGWTIFVDYDGDGIQDAGEPSAVTGTDGSYTIEGIKPGDYLVREIGPSGWTCSYPHADTDAVNPDGVLASTQCYYDLTFVSSGAETTGNDFGNWMPVSLSGVKFNDLDADGAAREAVEPGLPGWTIYVDYNDNGLLDADEPSAVTNGDGRYTITGIQPGAWIVREVAQDNWTCSYPNPCYYEESFVSGAALAGNDFGNWTTASKSGVKFEDLDADGIKDEGEPGLSGWTIYVDYDGDMVLDEGEPSAATDATGFYRITGILPGEYKVREVQQPGWTCSYPANCYYEEAFTSGADLTGNDFGNWTAATKSGMKFNDLDADGVKDDGEPGLSGWTIYVDYDNDEMLDDGEPSAVTDENGVYTITGIVPGTWKVREAAQDNWFCSYPNPCYYDETFESSDELTGNDFGNWEGGMVHGAKFEDLDMDGVAREDGEPGLAGWTIYVDYDGLGTLDPGEPFGVTDANGLYTIDGIKPGEYLLREASQTGWFCAYPASCGYSLTFTTGAEFEGKDFGNYTYATKSGVKFHDLNANRIWDAGEPPLAGWTIQAWQGDVKVDETTTDENGAYEFTLLPGSYTIKEVCQDGWLQSLPAATDGCGSGVYEITLTSRQEDRDNNFGNFQQATKSGVKFEDLDADGEPQEAGESGLAGWTIHLYGVDGMGNDVHMSTTTAGDGSYSFTVNPGSYTVCEGLEVGWWHQSYPSNTTPGTTACTSYGTGIGYGIVLASGDVETGNDFGNWQGAAKSGMKFEDMLGDGVKDEGDPGLAGWTIFVDYDDDGELDAGEPSAVTDGDGLYTIYDIKPGNYKVREVQQDGWTCTFPAGCFYEETFVSSGVYPGNDFGNFEDVTVTACKLQDLDGDVTTLDQYRYAFWPVDLTIDGERLYTGAKTGPDGCITWTGLGLGHSYGVVEDLLDGWTPLTDTSHDFGPAVSGSHYEYTFINLQGPVQEGCTPGYWKQDQHFDSWPEAYSPDATVKSIFDPMNTLSGISLDDLDGDGIADTLLAALNYGGGRGIEGSARNLLRAAVAALLNASHPDVNYSLGEAEIINLVYDALATGKRNQMLLLAEQLDGYNNLRACPLN